MLYRVVVKQFNEYKSTFEVQTAFEKVTDTARIEGTGDYKQQLHKEMGKFCGRITDDGLSQSDITSQTGAAAAHSQAAHAQARGMDHSASRSDLGSEEKSARSNVGRGGAGGQDLREEL